MIFQTKNNKMRINKLSNAGLKALFDLADSLKNAIKVANADGKINIVDFPAFVGVLFNLPAAIQAVKTVADEVTDLTPTEVEELKARLRTYSKDENVVDLVGYLLLALTSAFAIAKK